MSNVASIVIQDVEVAAEKVLEWLGAAGKIITKSSQVEPQVVAALGTLLGAVEETVATVSADVAAPSITLSAAAIADIKAVWPDIVSFAATLGIKI